MILTKSVRLVNENETLKDVFYIIIQNIESETTVQLAFNDHSVCIESGNHLRTEQTLFEQAKDSD